jgi:hypothetical protein
MDDAIGFDPTLSEGGARAVVRGLRRRCRTVAGAPVRPERGGARGVPTSGVTDFVLVSDEVLSPRDGLRGVHSVFRYRVGDGPMQMRDQAAYLNDDASKLYMFFVRCSTECYEQRREEIGNMVSSFSRPPSRT